ncbi:T9SS type A sorting domain-containing protein [Parabacteroides sp. Marseille-P3160]|uniref:T9SS type A sorting domain-containing protein n=1 Tax=Parabacteroides sp. Marseille-P3160 TaxID=1917887 RepID=UPI0009BB6938|nr:T9SS type A sorting domain-containing protein [Parabacteroides sp. Marseille-P3160]
MNKTFRVFLILVTILSGFIFIPDAKAQFTITENFRGSSVGSNIIVSGRSSDPTKNAYLTSGKIINGNLIDPVNDGWLRLTEDKTDRAGYAYINTSFPSTLGIYVEFEYKSWRTVPDNTYGGADGFSVFLFDATVPEFKIGMYGGSLGYANRDTDNNGLAGAYIGIGIDEYGNFANNGESRHGGAPGPAPDNNLYPNSIVLRGPDRGEGNYKESWKYLTHKWLGVGRFDNSTQSVDYYKSGVSSRPDDNTFYRKVKIVITPVKGITERKYDITVKWATSPGGADITLLSYQTEDVPPDLLKLGFAASTGGGINYHEIRNILITTPGNVRVTKAVDKANILPGNVLTYTVNVDNDTPAKLTGIKLEDIIKIADGSTVSTDDFEITGITFNKGNSNENTASNIVNHGNSFSADLTMAANSSASFTVQGTVKNRPVGGLLKNTVSIDPSPSGITDEDLNNNYAETITNVLSPNIDLAIIKTVDNNGIVNPANGNTFTIRVANLGNDDKRASSGSNNRSVTVTDTIPDGLDVVGTTGEGWGNPTINGNIYTFTRTDVLPSTGEYPPITIKVKKKTTATGTSWTNKVGVQGGTSIIETTKDNNWSSATLSLPNYWMGGTANKTTDWGTSDNWTAKKIPATGENVEFATVANYGTAAINDLYLDMDRTIGNLVNASDKNLVITPGNALSVNGTVTIQDKDNPAKVLIQTTTDNSKATGSLILNPNYGVNKLVKATVEFYSKAYQCADCGFYRNSWQYFGIPVQSSVFPYSVPTVETVNEWSEPTNGNKWIIPTSPLVSFKGYEITSTSTVTPSTKYNFTGTLNVGDVTIPLTKTSGVNYSGINLIGNSYTAAIPISQDAIQFSSWANSDETVYLFNTGTRDQWHKLDGSIKTGTESGQYQAVPLNTGGTGGLPDRIPSMHTFMVNAAENGTLTLKYGELKENDFVNGVVWRSAEVTRSTELKPEYIVMDVIGSSSADRVWLFEMPGTTAGFDNGWDGYKIEEDGIVQIYVNGEENERYQVATVPQLQGVTFGLSTDKRESYTLDFAVTSGVEARNLYLRDLLTNQRYAIRNGAEYTVTGGGVLQKDRFEVETGAPVSNEKLAAPEVDVYVANNVITIANHSEEDCTVSVYNVLGKLVAMQSVSRGDSGIIGASSRLTQGVYIVKVRGEKSLNETKRVLVR